MLFATEVLRPVVRFACASAKLSHEETLMAEVTFEALVYLAIAFWPVLSRKVKESRRN